MDPRILDGISGAAAGVGSDKSCPDDDFVDRVNHTYTTNILMFFTAVVLSRQMTVKPISCWIPNDFTGAQGEYAETVCWVTSTYFIPMPQMTVPLDEDLRYEKRIYYYQWVPFILMLQAAMFVVPCIVWRLFNSHSRINMRTVMDVLRQLKSIPDSMDRRRDLINCLVRHLEDALMMRHFRRQRREKKTRTADPCLYGKGWSQVSLTGPHLPLLEAKSAKAGGGTKRFSTPTVPLSFSRQSRVPGPRPCNPASSAFLSGLYLAVKMLYLANSASQLGLTGKFLNGHSFIFGIEALRDLMNTRFWDTTGFFPRVALCDFELRRMGSNQHRYTIQCVLKINIFNEKIFIFLWFWFFFVTVLNLLSLLRWFYKLMFQSVRVLFIRNLICIYYNIIATHSRVPLKQLQGGVTFSAKTKENENELKISDVFVSPRDLKDSCLFTEDILSQDGVLLLRFISMNVSPVSAAELAGSMWVKYRKTASTNATRRPLEDVVLMNMTAAEAGSGRSEKPPAIPPKRRAPGRLNKTRVKPAVLTNFSAFMHHNKEHHEGESDRSSESSRPTIEMLQERSRYRSRRRNRGNYGDSNGDDEELGDRRRSVFCEDRSLEGFVDFHQHDSLRSDNQNEELKSEVYIPDPPSEEYRDDRGEDERSFEDY